jgi:hypothetical protein
MPQFTFGVLLALFQTLEVSYGAILSFDFLAVSAGALLNQSNGL